MPVLTLKVGSPANHASLTNPLLLRATAFGNNVSQIQVWVSWKKVLQVNGNSLAANLWLPVGKNQRLAIHATNSKGKTVKVVQTMTVQ